MAIATRGLTWRNQVKRAATTRATRKIIRRTISVRCGHVARPIEEGYRQRRLTGTWMFYVTERYWLRRGTTCYLQVNDWGRRLQIVDGRDDGRALDQLVECRAVDGGDTLLDRRRDRPKPRPQDPAHRRARPLRAPPL